MCLSEDMYVVYGDTIWLPVEVTLYGKPFINAWREGLMEYWKWREKGELKLVDVHKAWLQYQRAHLLTPISEMTVPTLTEMDEQILQNTQQIKRLQDDFLMALERGVQTTPDDLAQRNRLGITYVGIGKFENAEKQFQQILTMAADNAAAHNNLANLYVIGDRADAAISSYEKALNLSPDDPGIYLNLGMGYLATDNQTGSQKMLSRAFQQLEDYRAACNLVGMPSQEPVARGAETPLMANEIRSLFISAAEGNEIEIVGEQLRQRAEKAGGEEIYLYWKR